MPFSPSAGAILEIDGTPYSVAEHPAAPGVPYGQEGRAGTVYRLDSATAADRAFKVFKPRFRNPGLTSLSAKLEKFSRIPGLQVCRRIVLTPQRHAALLRAHPELTYAVLMPWVVGPTWMEVMLDDNRVIAPEQGLRLARELAEILSQLEQEHAAHCDLSGANVIITDGGFGVALVDVEQMFAPELSKPDLLTAGSAGYAHKTAPGGLWSAQADRFAGAILMAEMLAIGDSRVGPAAGESFFRAEEVQTDSLRYRRMQTVLCDRWGNSVAQMFERSWLSETLRDCVTFGEWLVTLPPTVTAHASPMVTGSEATLNRTVITPTDLAAPYSSHSAILTSGHSKAEAKDGTSSNNRQSFTLDNERSHVAQGLALPVREFEGQVSQGPTVPATETGYISVAALGSRQSRGPLITGLVVVTALCLVLISAGAVWQQQFGASRMTQSAAAVQTRDGEQAVLRFELMSTVQAQLTATRFAQQEASATAAAVKMAVQRASEQTASAALTATMAAQSMATTRARTRLTATANAYATERAQQHLTATKGADQTATFAAGATHSAELQVEQASTQVAGATQTAASIPALSVLASPSSVQMPSGGYHVVIYSFSERLGAAVTITSRTGQFYSPTGERLGARIGPYQNSIHISANGTATWADNIYLPPHIHNAAREVGITEVILGSTFVGQDAQGHPVTVVGSLRITVTP